MGTQPPRKGTPADGEPLWVDADWWREMLGTRNKEPATPAPSPRADASSDVHPDQLADLPTAPQPAFDGRPSPGAAAEAGPVGHEVGVDGPPVQAPVEPPPAATWPAVPPAPPEEVPPPVRGQEAGTTRSEAPATGAPAPPAVPRSKRGPRPVEPPRGTRIPRVPGPEAPDAGPGQVPPARTALPPRPEAKVPVAPLPPVSPGTGLPPPGTYIPPDAGRPRVVDFFLRHLGDLALLLLAAGVIALVYLVLGS